MCNMTKFEPFCALCPFLVQQHGHLFPLKTLQILQLQQPPQQTQQPHRQHSSTITATTSTAIMTAEATMAEANVKKETVLSRLLFLPPSHPSGSAVGMDVGVGIIWLLVSVASAENRFRDNCYQKDMSLTHYDFQYRSGSIVGLLQLCG